MKVYDLKIALKGNSEKTHWKTIGKVFTADHCKLVGDGDKPAGFGLDWPEARGIIVPYEAKKTTDKREPGSEG